MKKILALVALAFALSVGGCGSQSITDPTSELSVPATLASFDQTISQDNLVLVKFGATWCPPCRKLDTELKSLAGNLPSDVKILKVDVDDYPELAMRYEISSIPRTFLMRNGEILEDEVGFLYQEDLRVLIGQHRTGTVQANPYAQ